MPENVDSVKNLSQENVNEILHLETPRKDLWTVFVEHPEYKISAKGFLSYVGNSVWRIDDIEFPAGCVKLLFRATRKIYLR